HLAARSGTPGSFRPWPARTPPPFRANTESPAAKPRLRLASPSSADASNPHRAHAGRPRPPPASAPRNHPARRNAPQPAGHESAGTSPPEKRARPDSDRNLDGKSVGTAACLTRRVYASYRDAFSPAPPVLQPAAAADRAVYSLAGISAPPDCAAPRFRKTDGRRTRLASQQNTDSLFPPASAPPAATPAQDSQSVPAEAPRADTCCKRCRCPDRSGRLFRDSDRPKARHKLSWDRNPAPCPGANDFRTPTPPPGAPRDAQSLSPPSRPASRFHSSAVHARHPRDHATAGGIGRSSFHTAASPWSTASADTSPETNSPPAKALEAQHHESAADSAPRAETPQRSGNQSVPPMPRYRICCCLPAPPVRNKKHHPSRCDSECSLRYRLDRTGIHRPATACPDVPPEPPKTARDTESRRSAPVRSPWIARWFPSEIPGSRVGGSRDMGRKPTDKPR